MATLEAGTTPTAATNWHRHIVQTCVPIEYLPQKILVTLYFGKFWNVV